MQNEYKFSGSRRAVRNFCAHCDGWKRGISHLRFSTTGIAENPDRAEYREDECENDWVSELSGHESIRTTTTTTGSRNHAAVPWQVQGRSMSVLDRVVRFGIWLCLDPRACSIAKGRIPVQLDHAMRLCAEPAAALDAARCTK